MLASLVTAWMYALVVTTSLFVVVVISQGMTRQMRCLVLAWQRPAPRTGTSPQAAPAAGPALTRAA
ncbi:MAG: hypothetical protein KY451_03380 [Actinobacteria bacterium]|nr:hypothetical protein [Actinomycetota bacterium]MBW3647309.1 hypothetical protein [Actinomycetota bacterium]